MNDPVEFRMKIFLLSSFWQCTNYRRKDRENIFKSTITCIGFFFFYNKIQLNFFIYSINWSKVLQWRLLVTVLSYKYFPHNSFRRWIYWNKITWCKQWNTHNRFKLTCWKSPVENTVRVNLSQKLIVCMFR